MLSPTKGDMLSYLLSSSSCWVKKKAIHVEREGNGGRFDQWLGDISEFSLF